MSKKKSEVTNVIPDYFKDVPLPDEGRVSNSDKAKNALELAEKELADAFKNRKDNQSAMDHVSGVLAKVKAGLVEEVSDSYEDKLNHEINRLTDLGAKLEGVYERAYTVVVKLRKKAHGNELEQFRIRKRKNDLINAQTKLL